MVTAEKRQAMRELAGRLSYFGIESEAADAITALANDVDKLLDELHKAEEKIYTIWQSAEELQRERDEASTQLDHYKAMIAAVPEYIKDEANVSLEEWFEYWRGV
jgi:peptidoglycan hydrolase CwlO-like protein